jgi:uroporphyrin-III C-methyltransferase
MVSLLVSSTGATDGVGAPGKVYLIGAGPGDPELITVKGLRCLGRADVVLYDRLVSEELLTEARVGAELIFVGKGPCRHSMTQDEINARMIACARSGRTVARLKGGDPFVFGRGGEEALALALAGIPFEVIPGISAAIAVPAAASIPVTHRDYASSVTIVTGHEASGDKTKVNWQALAQLGGTIVVLMGMQALGNFTSRLREAGLSPDLPAAVIQEGTTLRQLVVIGTLADIAERALAANLTSPATTVIGDVVNALHMDLSWGNCLSNKTRASDTPALAC